MNFEEAQCIVCYQDFNLCEHLPRMLPCGHTICTQCLGNILKGEPKCPLDSQRFDAGRRSIEAFRPNFSLRALVERRSQWKLCETHHKKAKFVCLKDRCVICRHCKESGTHKSHEVKLLLEMRPEIEAKTRELESASETLDRIYETTDKILEEKKANLQSLIEDRFDQIRFLVKVKEEEILLEIDSFFKHQRDILKCDLDKACINRKKITSKISDYKNAFKGEDPLKLFEEDISMILSKFKSVLVSEQFEKITEKLDNIGQMFDGPLNDLINSLITLKVPSKDLIRKINIFDFGGNMNQNFLPIDLNTTLSSFYNILSTIEIQTNHDHLEVTTTNKEPKDIITNLKKVEWKNIKRVTLHLERSQIYDKDTNTLSYIWSKLGQLQSIRVFAGKQQSFSKEQLSNLFSIIFWKPQSLQEICIGFDYTKIDDQNIIQLAEKVLLKAPNLTDIYLYLRKSNITNQAVSAIVQSIRPLLRNLKSLRLNFAETNVTEQGIISIFESMPSLKDFSLVISGLDFSDQGLGMFINKILSPCKALETLTLILWKTQVTDESVTKFFTKMTHIKNLTLYIGNTKITNRSIEKFLENQPTMKALKNLEISFDNTQVTRQMKEKIESIQKALQQN